MTNQEPQTDSKPNGAPATVTVEVPDGVDPKTVAKAAAEAGARYVVSTDVPKIGNMGDLLKLDAEGWPSTLAIPSPAGAIHFHLRIAADPVVAEAVKRVMRDHRKEVGKLLPTLAERLGVSATDSDGNQREAGDMCLDKIEGESPGERDRRVAEALEWLTDSSTEHVRVYAGALFDAGLVTTWDEDGNGIPFNRENFVNLVMRPGRAFLLGLVTRFDQLSGPRMEALAAEGEVSGGAQTGTRAAESSTEAS